MSRPSRLVVMSIAFGWLSAAHAHAQSSAHLSREEWEILRGAIVEMVLHEDGRREAEARQRALENGVDPALSALRSCDHAARNASGVPRLAADSRQRCASAWEKVAEGTPQLQGAVQACFAQYEAALSSLQASNELYEEARRAVSPRQGQLVKQAQELQREAKEQIKAGETCTKGTVDLAGEIAKLVAAVVQQVLSGGARAANPGGSGDRSSAPDGGRRGGDRATDRGEPPSSDPWPDPRQGIATCVAISDDARARLQALAAQLEPWWKTNIDATGQFFGRLAQMVWDDLVGIWKLGQGAFDRYGTSSNPGGQVIRDIERGVLDAQNGVTRVLTSEEEARKYDPVRLLHATVERYQRLVERSPGSGAADVVHDLVSVAPLPPCRIPRLPVNAAREGRALQRAETVTTQVQQSGQRAKAFAEGWGNQPQTGTRSAPAARVAGNAVNPQCGEFNCFAVSIAKSRELATGRPFSANAVRPGAPGDVPINSGEIADILGRTYATRGVRNGSLYTLQERIDHALGRPSRMDMNRIGTILTRSGSGAQGLVFVRTPAHQPQFPGETVGHVFNAHNQRGAVHFMDFQPAGGPMDARFWFLEATEIWFYEVR